MGPIKARIAVFLEMPRCNIYSQWLPLKDLYRYCNNHKHSAAPPPPLWKYAPSTVLGLRKHTVDCTRGFRRQFCYKVLLQSGHKKAPETLNLLGLWWLAEKEWI